VRLAIVRAPNLTPARVCDRRMMFRDRADAGRRLAALLESFAGREVVVLALPRGGVPVGFELARSLGAPLDVLGVRKLGAPGQEELALGAIASGGVRVLNEAVVAELGVTEEEIARVAAAEERELERREEAYRSGRPAVDVEGRVVILVDDGLATGASMKAAVRAVRGRSPATVVVAVPIGAARTCEELRTEADEVVCAASPWPFVSVGSWYDDFSQTSDSEVRELLGAAPR
jgi:putative phosphoribosyl transferase